MVISASSAPAATKTWDLFSGSSNGQIDNGAGTWNTATTNWTTDGGTSNTTWSDGDDAIFGGNPGVGAAGNITLAADRTALSLTFNNVPSGNFNLTSNTINFLATSTSITQNSSSAVTIASGVHGEDTTLTLGGGGAGAVTISGLLSEKSASHPLAITKTGTSNYILTNAGNSYTGVTNINGGTLTVNGTV